MRLSWRIGLLGVLLVLVSMAVNLLVIGQMLKADMEEDLEAELRQSQLALMAEFGRQGEVLQASSRALAMEPLVVLAFEDARADALPLDTPEMKEVVVAVAVDKEDEDEKKGIWGFLGLSSGDKEDSEPGEDASDSEHIELGGAIRVNTRKSRRKEAKERREAREAREALDSCSMINRL